MAKRDPRPARRKDTHTSPEKQVDAGRRERFDALSSDRQASLLDPAEDEFAAHGYDQASLNRILERACLSKGQAYYYVQDKAELYLLVIERAFARLGAAIGPFPASAEEPDAYWEAIRRLFKRIPVVLAQDAKLTDLARAIYPTSVAANAALEPFLARLNDRLRDHARLGQAIGAVRNDLPADFLAAGVFGFVTRVDRWFAMNGHNLGPDDAIRMNDVAVDMCRAMTAPPADQGPKPPRK